MAAALEELLAERPAAMRALIRGLSSYEFEEAVLSAYDAMRGAGMRVEELADFAAPPGATRRMSPTPLRALRRESLADWNCAQSSYLAGVLEGAERIVTARGTAGGSRSHREVSPAI